MRVGAWNGWNVAMGSSELKYKFIVPKPHTWYN